MMNIEKNIPIPEIRRSLRRSPVWDMQVGDSIVIVAGNRALFTKKNRFGMGFTTRAMPDGKVRVWRIA